MKLQVAIFDCMFNTQYVLKIDSIETTEKYGALGILGKDINGSMVLITADSIIAIIFKEIEHIDD